MRNWKTTTIGILTALIALATGAKEFLATVGYDPQLGARPLRRAIQRHVEDALSEKILYKQFNAGQIIVVDAEDDPENPGKKHIVFRAVEGFVAPSEPPLVGDADSTD